MTRKRMYGTIRTELERNDLSEHQSCNDVVDVAVDAALEYVLGFAVEVSSELIGSQLYSEAMVAGVFIRKLKALLGEDDSL